MINFDLDLRRIKLNLFALFLLQTSHSAFISILTVALQLCGIPIEFTHKLNFIFTALLAALKDFGVFLFSVIVVHCLVEYSITTGLLKYVMETWTCIMKLSFCSFSGACRCIWVPVIYTIIALINVVSTGSFSILGYALAWFLVSFCP